MSDDTKSTMLRFEFDTEKEKLIPFDKTSLLRYLLSNEEEQQKIMVNLQLGVGGDVEILKKMLLEGLKGDEAENIRKIDEAMRDSGNVVTLQMLCFEGFGLLKGFLQSSEEDQGSNLFNFGVDYLKKGQVCKKTLERALACFQLACEKLAHVEDKKRQALENYDSLAKRLEIIESIPAPETQNQYIKFIFQEIRTQANENQTFVEREQKRKKQQKRNGGRDK